MRQKSAHKMPHITHKAWGGRAEMDAPRFISFHSETKHPKLYSVFKKMIFGIGFGGGKNHFFER